MKARAARQLRRWADRLDPKVGLVTGSGPPVMVDRDEVERWGRAVDLARCVENPNWRRVLDALQAGGYRAADVRAPRLP